MSQNIDDKKSFSVTIPINGLPTPGQISWSIELGAQWCSDCGTHTLPVSRDDWGRLLAGADPLVGVSFTVKF